MPRPTAVRFVAGLLTLILADCAGGRTSGLKTLEIVAAPVRLTPAPALPYARALAGEALYNVRGLAWLGDTLVMADGGNDRVVWTDGASVGSFGRSGGGPGELRRPSVVEASPGGVVVLDAGNGRLARFDRAGGVDGVVVLPHAASSFGLLPDGAAVLSDGTGEAAFAWLGGGEVEGRGVRPPASSVAPLYAGARPGVHWYDRVAVVDGRVVVADAKTGSLGVYDPTGARLAAWALPPAMLRSLFDAMRRVDEGFGGAVAFTPLYRDLVPAGGGRVFLYVGGAGLAGLLVDPVAGTARVVLAPAGDAGRAAMRSSAVVVRAGVYAFGTFGGVAFYRSGERGG